MAQPIEQPLPTWQLVIVLWGTKYSVREVNRLIDTVREKASQPFRPVLITDRDRPGLAEDVVVKTFPEGFIKPEMIGPGCHAKLSMFEAGVVPRDLPAVYVDIDTVVLGDLARLLSLPKTDQAVILFQSAVIPIGKIGRFIFKITNGRKYARGNSSIVVYHPRECGYIAEKWHEMFTRLGGIKARPMIADERFMSWCAQEHLQRIPRDVAVKFPTEFMLPWRWLILTRASLPWVRRRWAGLLAVTLPGIEVKGDALLAMEEGTEVVDKKGRRLIWSEKAIGPMKSRLLGYYRALDAGRKETGA
ncbi:hypothetical protein BXY66_1523 [Shimia isoporae]|uniref:Glycosyl transferase family 8 n=1 Tax=Shimia isoporae TaxID=647720 RepID=A0A4R1NMR8_9RHOB|nr:hypothetical protein [Shimia isoporae]TCL09475.1 hypothetical protein BXY66_1523 [Shimia isoporae]